MNNVPRVMATALAAVVALAGCGGHQQRQRSGPPPLPVDVAKAQRQDIATYLSLDGQIAPLQESTLSSPQSGTLAAVYVNEGERVSQGQLLAKIDDSALRAQLAQNQAQVAQAAAKLQSSTLQNPITAQQVSGAVTTAEQQLAQARNSLASAQAALTNARLVYNSNRQLLSQGYVSQTTYEQSHAQYVAAQQQVYTAENGVRSAQAALATARQNTGQTAISQQDIANNRGVLEQMRASVQLLQTQIAQTNVVAPFDGVVTARLLDPGAFAGPNAPIVRVSQIARVYVNVNVPDEDLAYVRPGTRVTFTTSSRPGAKYSGSIADVNATPTQGTLSYRARIVQPNPDSSLRGGMLVSVTVRKDFHPNALVVPRSAIFTNENGANVFTIEAAPAPPAASGGNAAAGGGGAGPGGAGGAAAPSGPPPGKAVAVPVVVGLQTDTMSEIRSDRIHAGTPVITTRPDALQDGSTVAIVGPRPGGGGAPGDGSNGASGPGTQGSGHRGGNRAH